MTITIKTALDKSIYKSEGGGETRTRYEWAAGPRNLLKAVDTLLSHRKDMLAAYGNIGCGKSWLEVDGQIIDSCTIDDLQRGDADIFPTSAASYMPMLSRTAKAKALIEQIRAGKYSFPIDED